MNHTFQAFKNRQSPAAFVTVYDAAFARLAERAGAAGLIVGDTVGTFALGFSSQSEVALETMCHHAAAVRRGASTLPIIADVPLRVVDDGEQRAADACAQLARMSGADALKIEGAAAQTLKLIRRVVASGHAVSGHLEADGRPSAAIIDDARRLSDAGVACIVLVSIDSGDAATITRTIAVPTIGKNAGPDCDAQIVNAYQAFGLTGSDSPLRAMLESAIARR